MTPAIRLNQGESALFGYGSLISRPSLEATLGRPYDGPYVACAIRGWRRTWNAAMPNATFSYSEPGVGIVYPKFILYLNVMRDAGRLLNGMLFVVDAPALAAFDRRESIYDRVAVSDALEGVRVEGGEAYVYVARPHSTMTGVTRPADAAIRASYLRILDDGFAQHGAEFRTAYDASSDAPPAGLVIDDQRSGGA